VLSRSAEYAVRALSLLAVRGDREPVQSREIADALGLPPQFLAKILRRLTATGLVASQRGRAGGFRLSKAPDSIALLEVVMPFEEPRSELDCLLGQGYCTDFEDCPLHQPMMEIQNAYIDLLQNTKLADVASRAIRTPARSDIATETTDEKRPVARTIGGS
jgi:Rrf2 family protein